MSLDFKSNMGESCFNQIKLIAMLCCCILLCVMNTVILERLLCVFLKCFYIHNTSEIERQSMLSASLLKQSKRDPYKKITTGSSFR